ncbi:MAG: hypothetical protein ACRETF_02610 [Nevskiaceae bacterium]
MTFRAPAFGLTLASNLPIPGLASRPERAGEAAADLRVILGEAPPAIARSRVRYEHPQRDGHGAPWLVCRETEHGHFELRYSDGLSFHFDPQASSLWVSWPDSYTLDSVATYLLGPVFAFLLRLRGHVCLHASSAHLGRGCVAFAGASGCGKSTLAAAFAQRGASILADDVSCLLSRDAGIRVQPGYPLIRLWDQSARLLDANPDSLPLAPGSDKRHLSLTDGFHDRSEPLAAIFALTRRREMSTPAVIRPLAGLEAATQLLGNTYGYYLLDRAMREREFEVLGRLAREVPVFELALSDDGRDLAAACAIIESRVNLQ